MTTIEEFRERIAGCWSCATAYRPAEWSEANPARGQCLATALVARDVFGGSIIHGVVHGEYHYWNLLPGVGEVDFTRCQWGFGPHSATVLGITRWTATLGPHAFESATPIIEDKDFWSEDLFRRYLLLKTRYAFSNQFPFEHLFTTSTQGPLEKSND